MVKLRKLLKKTYMTAVSATFILASVWTLPASAATIVSETPIKHFTTNGDILATEIIPLANGTRALAIGGNFTQVIRPNGTAVSATNFAIVNLLDPNQVLYAATGVNSYVREIESANGYIYVGGDFTTFAGQARSRLAALNTNASFGVASWNPGAGARIEALATSGGLVYYGGNLTKVYAVNPAEAANPGSVVWSLPISGGSVRAIATEQVITSAPGTNPVRSYNRFIYVGGLFEQAGSVVQHGLVRVSLSTGTVDTTFAPNFRKNSFVGEKGTWDGDCILSLMYNSATNRLIVGSGGAARNMLTYLDRNGSGAGTAWGASTIRNSEGDVQAVAIVGSMFAMGYHRGHTNHNTTYFTKRYLTLWNSSNGAISTWDGGLWGGQSNIDEGNGGVQAMSYDGSAHLLVVAGAFMGYGDKYDDTAADLVGAPGVNSRSLAIFPVTE